jgi:serine/threonine protein kinase
MKKLSAFYFQPISTRTQTPSSSNSTDRISVGQLKMKEAIDNVNSRPIELPVEFIINCTNNFDVALKLGQGALGAVYEGKHDNRYFTFIRMLFDFAVEKDKVQDVSKSLKTEYEVSSFLISSIACRFKSYVSLSSIILFQSLKSFQHPHIVILFEYHLSPGLPSQYLVYEFASKGSLDTFYASEQRRASLSSERQLRIMFDIIRAIHFLHTDTHDNHILFHGDIKSANICVQQNYTAKLIDCGLAKFVPVDDSISTRAIPFLVWNTSHGGIFGTPGYTCPWYSRGNKTFEASCDVYSFGMVMIELVTGCLQMTSWEISMNATSSIMMH